MFLNDYVQGTSLIHFSDFTTAPQLPTSTMTIREPCITHMAPHVHYHSTTFEYDTANHHCHRSPQKLFFSIIVAELSSSVHHLTPGTILTLPLISIYTPVILNLPPSPNSFDLRIHFWSSRPPSARIRVIVVM